MFICIHVIVVIAIRKRQHVCGIFTRLENAVFSSMKNQAIVQHMLPLNGRPTIRHEINIAAIKAARNYGTEELYLQTVSSNKFHDCCYCVCNIKNGLTNLL